MDTRFLPSVPGVWKATLTELQVDDPDYAYGHTLAQLRAMLKGNDTGTLRTPGGAEVEVSLAPWSGRDPETTRLRLGFTFIPHTPIAPTDPRYIPPPTRQPTICHTSPQVEAGDPQDAVAPAPPPYLIFIVVHDRASNHRVEIRPVSAKQPPLTIGDIRRAMDVSQSTLPCPLCDTVIDLAAPLEEALQHLARACDGDATPVDICVHHPHTIAERKELPATSLIRVARTWSS
ncbi:MAG: hypothetical protein NZ699_07735 [Roseiflexus sp.]|nr:hypothetical protein [Roseiflexus sp.]MCS7289006.1 hypothetical protein [Roseiflexus sp.]MDW8146664.1 hypothetical protein [Roseiflexaceae bacterium]MDW8234159.1 hypothetical protein [Roseiflexaceae bacterium]